MAPESPDPLKAQLTLAKAVLSFLRSKGISGRDLSFEDFTQDIQRIGFPADIDANDLFGNVVRWLKTEGLIDFRLCIGGTEDEDVFLDCAITAAGLTGWDKLEATLLLPPEPPSPKSPKKVKDDRVENDERNARTTPIGLFHYARSYWQCADLLFKAKPNVTHPLAPTTFLYYHAIELYLKAFLRMKGISVNELQYNFGHGVSKLSDKAASLGLNLMDEDREVLALMSERDNVISARYITTGFFSIAAPEALSRTCQSLDGSVGEALKTAGILTRPLSNAEPSLISKGADETDILKQQRDVEKYIPFMNDDERKIIAYLLEKKQKMFTCTTDGGHAVTLISRGIIRSALQPGQRCSPEDWPVQVPDHIWDVLTRNKDAFPYSPPKRGETEPHPWRVHWMLR